MRRLPKPPAGRARIKSRPRGDAVKVTVTGGAGFLGINLIRHLLGRGVTDLVSLDIAPLGLPERGRIKEIRGDIRDSEVVRRAVRGAEVVVHCAAALPLADWRDIRTTEVLGTGIALEEARRAGAERFVHISSTAVYGIPHRVPVLETDALIGVGPYGRAKIAAERLCEEKRSAGMSVSVLRPKSFIGPERLGVFALLYEWAEDGRSFPLPGGGTNRYQLLDVEDLCAAVWCCMAGELRAVNDTFNVGASDFRTLREDFQCVLDEAGHGKHVVGIPAVPSIFALRALASLGLSPLYRWVYETVAKESIVSIRKIQQGLGFRPVHSNKDALLRNFRWYRENRTSFQGRSGTTHRSLWSEGALRLARLVF
jgi:nucleoside-diphosphate-sugar epimerase